MRTEQRSSTNATSAANVEDESWSSVHASGRSLLPWNLPSGGSTSTQWRSPQLNSRTRQTTTDCWPVTGSISSAASTTATSSYPGTAGSYCSTRTSCAEWTAPWPRPTGTGAWCRAPRGVGSGETSGTRATVALAEMATALGPDLLGSKIGAWCRLRTLCAYLGISLDFPLTASACSSSWIMTCIGLKTSRQHSESICTTPSIASSAARCAAWTQPVRPNSSHITPSSTRSGPTGRRRVIPTSARTMRTWLW